jgi:hypothetical protein
MSDYSDTYLDNIEKAYEIQALQAKYVEAINDASGDTKAQESLTKLMNTQLTNLKSQDKITKA